MKKLISVLLVTLMLLSTATVVMADDTTTVTSIELLTHQVNSKNMLLLGYPPKADSNSYNFNPSSYKIGLANNSVVDGVYRAVLGCQNGVTFESVLNGGNLEDYAIEFTATKAANSSYVTDFEFGFGVANMGQQAAFSQGKTYANFATVTKTVPFEAFDTAYAAKKSGDTIMTLTIPVKDILNKGVEEYLMGTTTTTYPEFDASAINEFVVKATCTTATGSNWPGVMTFTSVKLVKKSADITYDEGSNTINFSACDYTVSPLLAGNQAIIAYYDTNSNGVLSLSLCEVVGLTVDTNTAGVSVPINETYAGSDKIKAFLFNSMDDITPLTKVEVIR